MPDIGQHVLYTVPREHETKTVKGDKAIEGSIYHPEQKTFAGVVGRVHPDGSADIHLFVPNRDAKWVDAVHEGDGPGTYKLPGPVMKALPPPPPPPSDELGGDVMKVQPLPPAHPHPMDVQPSPAPTPSTGVHGERDPGAVRFDEALNR